MSHPVFTFPTPSQPMAFDGERYTTGIEGAIQHEHYHRYLFALRWCAGRDVLDVASGEGYGSVLLGQVARSVIGVDIDQAAVDFATANYATPHVTYRQGDATRIPVPDHSVDVVVSFETIEHFADQSAFIAEIDRVLRPGGVVVISSPNRDIYTGVLGNQNPFHVHEMNQAEFEAALRQRFAHLWLLEQGPVLGSVMVPVPGMSTQGVEGFWTLNGSSFGQMGGVPGAAYLIAVASRDPLAPPPQSVLHAPNYLGQLQHRLRELTDQNAQLRAKLAELSR